MGSARIYFRAPGHGEWYWVSMRVEGDALHGVLPKPTRRLAAFDYYIEVIGFHMATARTPEVTVRVEPGCHDMGLVLAVATAPVVVGVSGAGLPLVPLGFSSANVVAAGATAGSVAAAGVASATAGGVPTTALVAGGLVVGGLAVAVAGGGGEAAPSAPVAPAPTCPPPSGSGPVQSQSFAWTLPGGATQVAQRFDLPFPVTGAGVVEARTSYPAGSRVCTCVGTANLCRAACALDGTNAVSVPVCDIAELTPGQWWFQVYCQQDAGVCLTPLPAAGLSGTTTVTYTPRQRISVRWPSLIEPSGA